MLSAEPKTRVVASRKETTAARDGGRGSQKQTVFFFLDELAAADTARKVIPFVQPSPEEPDPEPAPKPPDNPSHDIDFPPSSTPYDQWPDKFTKIPFAIASEYGRKLGPTQTRIFEVMHDMIHGYTEKPDSRHRRGQISQNEIAEAAGVGLRTVQRYIPQLIKYGFVELISPGRRNQRRMSDSS